MTRPRISPAGISGSASNSSPIPANFDIPFRLVHWTTADTYGRALYVSRAEHAACLRHGDRGGDAARAARRIDAAFGQLARADDRRCGSSSSCGTRRSSSRSSSGTWRCCRPCRGRGRASPCRRARCSTSAGSICLCRVLGQAAWGWVALLLLVAMALLCAVRGVRAKALVLLPVAIAVFCMGVDHLDRPALARLQHPGRRAGAARARGALARAFDLRRGVHRRDRACRDPRRAQGAARGGAEPRA